MSGPPADNSITSTPATFHSVLHHHSSTATLQKNKNAGQKIEELKKTIFIYSILANSLSTLVENHTSPFILEYQNEH
jgi:hypothetical protein